MLDVQIIQVDFQLQQISKSLLMHELLACLYRIDAHIWFSDALASSYFGQSGQRGRALAVQFQEGRIGEDGAASAHFVEQLITHTYNY